MTLDWAKFTPWSALSGGAILGLAAVLLVLMNGRILGISGITAGLFGANRQERAWRFVFLLGLLSAPWLWQLFTPLRNTTISHNTPLLILAGLLVGFGTRMGSGCTSGHGVCGLARLSRRSLVATLSFMAAGFAVVYLLRHGLLQGLI